MGITENKFTSTNEGFTPFCIKSTLYYISETFFTMGQADWVDFILFTIYYNNSK